jgi:hypothetical protein
MGVFRARGYASGHIPPDDHRRQHYVTVRRVRDRYPWARIWVEPAGITWGDNFEHERPLGPVEDRSVRLVDAVLATESQLEQAQRPATW